MTPRFHPLRIADIRAEAPDAVSMCFEVPPPLAEEYRFVEGQHLTLRAHLDGEELRRSYSICSAPADGELRIAIKAVPGGRFSHWAVSELKPGDAVDVMTPEGRFHALLDPAHPNHYVAFAAGSGITPVLSLIRSRLAEEPQARFTLVYGNRSPDAVMFHEALEDLKDRYMARFALYHVFSRQPQETALFNGRIDRARTRALLDSLIPAAGIDAAFVCGPASMIDEVEAALLDAGVPAARIHAERFGAPRAGAQPVPEPQMEESAPGAKVELAARIAVTIDGLRREFDFKPGQHSILEAGLAAGLELPFSCRAGMCCTCRARLLEGEVRMRRQFALEPADLAAHFVLACQAYPLTPRVALSFDDR
ncbi:MAG TPA: 1,2-phenylacetyl-CoA epoxidase subunit PaaE [Burkholderiaceae bacterium]